MRDLWADFYKQAGSWALTEQLVPELNLATAARADIRVRAGAAAPTRYCDVVVTHPIHRHHDEWHGKGAGIAVAAAERQKVRDYQPAAGGSPVLLTPLAFETYGRWGRAAAAEVRRLARARAMGPAGASMVNPEAMYQASLLRWRREVAVTLQCGNAEVLLACAGRPQECILHVPPSSEPLDLVPALH